MAYVTQSPDTSREFEEVLFSHLRAAGSAKRRRLMNAHIATGIRVSRAAIARRNPEWSQREVALRWAAMVYGEELAARVRQYLREHDDER